MQRGMRKTPVEVSKLRPDGRVDGCPDRIGVHGRMKNSPFYYGDHRGLPLALIGIEGKHHLEGRV